MIPRSKQKVQIPQAEVHVEPAKVPTNYDNPPPPQPPQNDSSPIQPGGEVEPPKSEPTSGTCQTGSYYQKAGMECCQDESSGKEICSK